MVVGGVLVVSLEKMVLVELQVVWVILGVLLVVLG